MGGGNKAGGGARQIALPAVLGALALLMLYGACLLPTGLWGWTAVAGLGPLAAVASLGVRTGLLCWGGVSLLALLLLPDKFCALLFTLLFGLYPVVKSLAERVVLPAARYLLKLLFFNAAFTALLLTMGALMTATLPSVLAGRLWLLYLAGNVVFLIYDFGLTKLICFYLARVDRAVRKGGRFGSGGM